MSKSSKAAKSILGLTMVELAVVLVIMGLVGTVFYTTITKFIGKLKEDEVQEQVVFAQEKLRGFYSRNSTLPSAVDIPSDPGNEIYMPEALGDTEDAWGQRLHYYPAESLVNATSNATETVNLYSDFQTLTTGGLPDRTITDVAYVVISLGPNQQQDYTEGSVNLLSPSGARQRTDGREYDDIAQFVTVPELRGSFEQAFEYEPQETGPPSDYAFRLDDEEGDFTANGGQLIGASNKVNFGTEDGLTVLDLHNNQGSGQGYADLTNHPANAIDYETYTIMGWYKTNDSNTNTFEPIISRQGSSWQNRTWWVTLWSSAFDGQGGVDQPGELALKAESQSQGSFFADSNYPESPGEKAHHDQEWHFFAAVMSKDETVSPAEYTSTVFVSDARSGAEQFLKGTDTTTLTSPPRTATTYGLYIGYNPQDARYFQGYIDDIIIYSRALSDTEIEDHFESSKADHGY